MGKILYTFCHFRIGRFEQYGGFAVGEPPAVLGFVEDRIHKMAVIGIFSRIPYGVKYF